MQGFSAVRKAFLTIRSSREWKVIMQSLPPGRRKSIISAKDSSRTLSSWLSSIRMAWNVFLAGWPERVPRTFCGIAPAMTSESSKVVSMGCFSLSRTICLAMFLANLSSP